MNGNSLSRIAYGTINPFSFIIEAPGILNGALQASGSTAPIIGIAQEWVNLPMGTIWQQTTTPQGYPAALSGQEIRVYEDFDSDTLLMVGSGYTVEPGNLLTSDASGWGVPISITTSGQQWVGARAIEGGPAGTVIRVKVYTRPITHS